MGSYRLQVQLTPTYNGIVCITAEMVYAGIIHKLKYHFDKPTLTTDSRCSIQCAENCWQSGNVTYTVCTFVKLQTDIEYVPHV